MSNYIFCAIAVFFPPFHGTLTAKRQMVIRGEYRSKNSVIQSRAQCHHDIDNGSMLIFTWCPMREKLVISFGTCQGPEREQIYACGDGLAVFQGILHLRFVLPWQRCRVLCQKFEYVASNKVMAALVGYTQNVYNAEGVMRDSEAVIFDYKVLQDISIRHRQVSCAWKERQTFEYAV